MINIIKATIKHLDDINRLFDSYRVFYKAESNLKASRAYLQQRIENGDSEIFIAYIDDTAVGFTQIYPMFSSVSMQRLFVLNDLFVDPSYRGRGIGESLLNKGKDYTQTHLGKCLLLETAKDNPAQYLYERLGWKKDVEYHHYSWTPQNSN